MASTPVVVLVVEPDSAVRELLGEYLLGRGFAPTLVPTLGAARTAWAAARFDVVLTELALTDGSGIELLRMVGAEGAGALAMAASLSVPEAIAALRGGAEDVLTKPLRLREIYDAVRQSAARAKVRARERLARELFVGAARAKTAAEVGALDAILTAEAALLGSDAATAEACRLAVSHAADRCR